MTIPPYDATYREEAMAGLGDIFDLALRQKNIPLDEFADRFQKSKVAYFLEQGSLRYINGCSAQESVSLIMGRDFVQTEYIDYGAEYWTGFILAYLQWKINRPFSFILSRVPLVDILSMHHLYHEMCEERAVENLEKRLDLRPPLYELRTRIGFTQQELADLSGVNVRNIRAYEQGQNDISKASGETLYRLARALGCTMEYLLTGK
ncbi:MAG: helix-turn-helix transcriptional regulator [archaeon]|nr:helix-turn-helix transcriptional regulator [archaeon]